MKSSVLFQAISKQQKYKSYILSRKYYVAHKHVRLTKASSQSCIACASKQSTETSKETVELLLESVREGNGQDWRQHTEKVTHDKPQGFLSDQLVPGLGEKLAEDDEGSPGYLCEKAGKVSGEVDGGKRN